MGDRYLNTISLGWSEDMKNRYMPKEIDLMTSIVSNYDEGKVVYESKEDRFVEAASKSDLKLLLEFSSTMPVNSKNFKNETPLIAAAIGGHENAVFFLLSRGANVSLVDSTGNTALHHAALLDRIKIIDKLILKCDINLENIRGQTILHLAAENGKLDLLEHIMKMSKINMDAQDANGNTAIHIAIKKGNIKMTRKLLTVPIDVSIYNADGLNPLNLATIREDGLEFLKAILQTKKGKDILHCPTLYGESNLEIAIRGRNAEILPYLLSSNMHPEVMINSEIDRKYGSTSLHWAVLSLDLELMEKIIQINPSLLNVKDKFGKTPLDHICCIHQLEESTKERLVNVAIKLISEGSNMDLIENKTGLYKLIRDVFQFKFKL